MALQEEVGRAIREHRERRGLTQSTLAEAIGVSLQAVGKIERGRSAPSFATLEAAASVLGVPVRALFPAAGQSEDEVTARIVALLAPLSPAEREQAERVLLAMQKKG